MRNSPRFGFHRFFLLLPMAAVLVWSVICFGQTEAGSIYGRISDQSGAVVPGAEVRLHNIDTNVDLTHPLSPTILFNGLKSHFMRSLRDQGSAG